MLACLHGCTLINAGLDVKPEIYLVAMMMEKMMTMIRTMIENAEESMIQDITAVTHWMC